MLPWIIGGAILAVGTYMLNEASQENKRERNKYNDEYNSYKKEIEKRYSSSKNRDHIDKLYKMKRAKSKVADIIYREYESQNSHFGEINRAICEINLSLDVLFLQKRASYMKEEKQSIQIQINQILVSKKEIFHLKDSLKASVHQLREALKVANNDTRMLKVEIQRQKIFNA